MDSGDTLLVWLNSLSDELSSSANRLTDLADGVLLLEVLSLLAPDHFDVADINLLEDDASSANLATLVSKLDDYFPVVLSPIDMSGIDQDAIATNKDEAEICKLLELVYLAVLNSAGKNTVINKIMSMENEDVMQQLMEIAQEIMTKYDVLGGGSEEEGEPLKDEDEHSREYRERRASLTGRRSPPDSPLAGFSAGDAAQVGDLEDLQRDRNELQERVDVLAREIKELKRTNHHLGVEAEAAKAGAQEMVAEAVKEATETLERRHKEQTKSEQQAHVRAAGASAKRIADLEDELAAQGSALKVSRKRNEEATAELVAQNRVLQDELDVASEKAKKLTQAEVTLARYKLRLEQANSMRDQLKYKQESNSSSLERIAELEGEVAQLPVLKSQVEKHRSRVLELEAQLSEQRAEAEQGRSELKLVGAENKDLKARSKDLNGEIEALKAELEVMRSEEFSPMKQTLGSAMSSRDAQSERVQELEAENRRLKASAGTGVDTAVAELQSELDLQKQKVEMLDKKFVNSQVMVRKLERKLAGTGEKGEEDKDVLLNQEAEIERLKKKALDAMASEEEQRVKYKKLFMMAKQLKAKKEALQKQVQAQAQSSDKAVPSAQTEVLQQRIKELERQKRHWEDQAKRINAAKKKEQSLMSSAVHEMGLEYMRKRMSSGGQAHGWLNRQRDRV